MLQWSDGLGAVSRLLRGLGLRARPPYPADRSRTMAIRPTRKHRPLADRGVYLALFTLVLVRHELRMGYLSGRHTLMLVILSLPWAAAGTSSARRARGQAHLDVDDWPRAAGLLALAGHRSRPPSIFQIKPAHPSRWGHREAGRWLAGERSAGRRGARHPRAGRRSSRSCRLTTTGTSARRSPTRTSPTSSWETTSCGPRAVGRRRSARCSAYAAEPVAGFPEREGGRAVGVWVYRFDTARRRGRGCIP